MHNALRLFAPLDRELSEAMGVAFETAWVSLCSSGERLSAQQACDARIRLARAILDYVRRGERNPARLSEYALDSLVTPDLNRPSLAPEL
jgi:hypothetical protein